VDERGIGVEVFDVETEDDDNGEEDERGIAECEGECE
jgi:hypothetical protein